MSHWHLFGSGSRNHPAIEISQRKRQSMGRRLMEPWEGEEEEPSSDMKEDKRSMRTKTEGWQSVKKEGNTKSLGEVT